MPERMTMLSFRVAEAEAGELRRSAKTLGVDRSEILGEARTASRRRRGAPAGAGL
jgi:hypothetical protein